jgi:hypothetical protein
MNNFEVLFIWMTFLDVNVRIFSQNLCDGQKDNLFLPMSAGDFSDS